VDVFAAGTHRGKTYTEADLDDMVRNFDAHSSGDAPRLRVPAVLGHEETQEFLDRSDTPAAAWCTRVWREGPKLKADFSDVPPKVMQLLKGRRYRTVSAEVYDEPPEGVGAKGGGKMLRRVAFLGGEIPQVKSLDDIPLPEAHAEGRRFARHSRCVFKFSEIHRTPVPGLYRVFAEMSPMDPETQKMLDQLGQMGVDAEALKGCPPEALAEVLRALGDRDDSGGDDDDQFREFDEDELPDAPDDKKDSYAEQARKMGERAKKFMAKYCSADDVDKMADDRLVNPDPNVQANPGGAVKSVTTTHKYSEAELAAVAKLVAGHLAPTLKPIQDKVAGLDKFAEDRMAADKKATVKARLDALVAQGKVLPAERDAGLDDTAYALDATAVRKFSEKGGKAVSLTPFDHFFKTLEARPNLVRFGERVAAGKGSPDAADGEVAKVEAHYESFREDFAKLQTSKDDFVGAFKALKKRRPDATADSFLGARS
jgi:hypothetical protein